MKIGKNIQWLFVYLVSLSVCILFLSFHVSSVFAACPTSYTECETGAKNACTDSGVPAGHIGNVTLDCNGNYTCTDGGPCTSVVGYINPQGYPICTNGIGGWACKIGSADSVQVDFYDGPFVGNINNIIGSTQANIPSSADDEAAINSAQFCNAPAGSAHRFMLPVPPKFQDGKSHAVYGYININDNQIHQMPYQNQTFTCSPGSGTTSSGTASITLVVGLPGIGFNGPVGVLPKHLTRNVTIELYDATVTNPSGPGTHALATAQGSISFDSKNDNNAGYFVSTQPIAIPLPTTPAANNQYEILVKIPQDAFQLATNTDGTHVFTLTTGGSVTTKPFVMTAGDVAITNGGTNHINLDDYTVMLGCYGGNTSCLVKGSSATDINLADLNDDGAVDIVDLNIWLRSLNQLQLAQAPGCSTGDCQGD